MGFKCRQCKQTTTLYLLYLLEFVGGAGGWARFAVAHAADFLVLYPLPILPTTLHSATLFLSKLMILVTEKAMKNYIKCMTMQNKKGVHIQSIFERFMFQMFPAVPLCCKQMIGPASITIYASPSWSQSKHRTLKRSFCIKHLV